MDDENEDNLQDESDELAGNRDNEDDYEQQYGAESGTLNPDGTEDRG